MNKITKHLLTAVFALLAMVLTALVLYWTCFHIGTVKPAENTSVSTTDIMHRFDVFVSNASAEALGGIVPAKAVEELTVKEEKNYMFDRTQVVAPEPNQAYFKETTNPAEVDLVVETASDLLDGQDVYWDSSRELMPGTSVHYYMDETILAICWKEVLHNTVYTFTEVKVLDASQFRRYMADDTFGSSIQYRASEMAETVNAVAASNGDFYKHRNFGVVVYKGEALRVDGKHSQTLYVDMDGDFHFTHPQEIITVEEAQQYVDENNISFSLAFGPILIENGENVTPSFYPLGEPDVIYARSAICQLDTLHYLLVHVNGEGSYIAHATVPQLGKTLYERGGIQMAYTLDGGQTATCVFGGEVINRVVYGNERTMSDIVFFNTAIPNEEEAGS